MQILLGLWHCEELQVWLPGQRDCSEECCIWPHKLLKPYTLKSTIIRARGLSSTYSPFLGIEFLNAVPCSS